MDKGSQGQPERKKFKDLDEEQKKKLIKSAHNKYRSDKSGLPTASQ